jgi:hypothetical protein
MIDMLAFAAVAVAFVAPGLLSLLCSQMDTKQPTAR